MRKAKQSEAQRETVKPSVIFFSSSSCSNIVAGECDSISTVTKVLCAQFCLSMPFGNFAFVLHEILFQYDICDGLL